MSRSNGAVKSVSADKPIDELRASLAPNALKSVHTKAISWINWSLNHRSIWTDNFQSGIVEGSD